MMNHSCPFIAFILYLFKKPFLSKSFMGLTVQEYDNIYDKEKENKKM
jgi:hypothetical protein